MDRNRGVCQDLACPPITRRMSARHETMNTPTLAWQLWRSCFQIRSDHQIMSAAAMLVAHLDTKPLWCTPLCPTDETAAAAHFADVACWYLPTTGVENGLLRVLVLRLAGLGSNLRIRCFECQDLELSSFVWSSRSLLLAVGYQYYRHLSLLPLVSSRGRRVFRRLVSALSSHMWLTVI